MLRDDFEMWGAFLFPNRCPQELKFWWSGAGMPILKPRYLHLRSQSSALAVAVITHHVDGIFGLILAYFSKLEWDELDNYNIEWKSKSARWFYLQSQRYQHQRIRVTGHPRVSKSSGR
eukprot:scaffold1513_cov141-Cylindrotheca_fusiformis.AAC.1